MRGEDEEGKTNSKMEEGKTNSNAKRREDQQQDGLWIWRDEHLVRHLEYIVARQREHSAKATRDDIGRHDAQRMRP